MIIYDIDDFQNMVQLKPINLMYDSTNINKYSTHRLTIIGLSLS